MTRLLVHGAYGRNGLFSAFGDLVIADLATRAAVVQAVFPEPDVELALTQAAILITLAALLSLLALTADYARFRSHALTLARAAAVGNIPLVTLGRLWALGFTL